MSQIHRTDPYGSTHPKHTPLLIQCGQKNICLTYEQHLREYHFFPHLAADLVLVIDMPRGYALHHLEQRPSANNGIVVTWNPCPEYLADLGDLAPLLLADSPTIDQIAQCLQYIACGHTPLAIPRHKSPLHPLERRILRLAAFGYTNKVIAEKLHCGVQTVKNNLNTIFQKINVASRGQAILYYWGIFH